MPAPRVTITGTRATWGNAVDCPQIRDAAGVLHGVSALDSRLALGASVTVSGFYAVTTHCNGPVLVVEEQTPPPD